MTPEERRAKKRAKDKRYREAHPEKHAARIRRYYWANHARVREYRRAYYAKNSQKIRALFKESRVRCIARQVIAEVAAWRARQ